MITGARSFFMLVSNPTFTSASISAIMNNTITHLAEFILASQSPRRKALLQQAGLVFSVVPSGIDESGNAASCPENFCSSLALEKAKDIATRHPDSVVIGADTIVVIDGKILGKPEDPKDARNMLKSLSGRTHAVYTGFAVVCESRHHMHNAYAKTSVTFKPLTERDIEWYVGTEEPYDKAGAYAIQDLGTMLVKSIEGSYTNVVGLPVCEVMDHLIKSGFLSL